MPKVAAPAAANAIHRENRLFFHVMMLFLVWQDMLEIQHGSEARCHDSVATKIE